MMSSLKWGVRGCACTTASRSASLYAAYLSPSTSISTPAVTSATTGCMCCGMPGVVCSAIAVHTVSISCCDIPCPRRKSRAAFAPSTSKRSLGLLCRYVSPMSWNIAHGVEQLGIECHAAPHAGQRAPVEDAAGMVKEQRRFRVPHELRDLTRKLAVRDADSSDRD